MGRLFIKDTVALLSSQIIVVFLVLIEELIDLSEKTDHLKPEIFRVKNFIIVKFNSAIAPDDRNQRWPPELKKYVKFIENTKISVFLRQKEISYAEILVPNLVFPD